MQLAMESLSKAVLEVDEEENQINSLQEQNKQLSSKNRRLSVANQRISLLNRKLTSEKNLYNEISESKLKESNSLVAYYSEKVRKLENEIDSLTTASKMAGFKFLIINIKKLFLNLYKSSDIQEKLLIENEKLQRDINDLITCQICSEKFQSAGEYIACKLKCQHIMCKKCAEQWLNRVSFNFLLLTLKYNCYYYRL